MARKTDITITKDLLNWKVIEQPSFYCDPLTGDEASTGMKALIHSGTNQLIDNCSLKYPVFTNENLVEMAKSFEKQLNITFDRVIVQGGGKKVFILFKQNKDFSIGSLKVSNELLIANGHGGTMRVIVGSVSRYKDFVFLTNTLNTKARHDGNMHDNVASVMLKLNDIEVQLKQHYGILEKAMNINVTDEDVTEFKNFLFNLDKKEVTSQLETKLNDFDESVAEELQNHGKNLWGLYMGAVNFNCTKVPNFGPDDAPLFGSRNKLDRDAFKFVKEMVK